MERLPRFNAQEYQGEIMNDAIYKAIKSKILNIEMGDTFNPTDIKKLPDIIAKALAEAVPDIDELAKNIATRLALNAYWIDLQFNIKKTEAIGKYLAKAIYDQYLENLQKGKP